MDSHILADATFLGDPKWLFIIALILGATVLLNIYGRRRRAAGASPKAYTREVDSATRQSMVIKRDLESLLVEINEMSRVFNGQMDTRFAKLEISIADADRRISELRTLLIKAGIDPDGGGEPVDSEAVGDVVTPRLDLMVDDERNASVTTPADPVKADSRPNPSSRTVRTPTEEPTTKSGDNAPLDEMERFHRQVHQLSDEGRTSIEIAEITKRAIGEVELVLHLRRRAIRRSAAVDPLPADRPQ